MALMTGLLAHDVGVDAELSARARRRTFTAEYKARILVEYEAFPVGSDRRGALLRCEGLDTSHIAEWRRARDSAVSAGLEPKRRGRPPTDRNQVELERLRRRNGQLEADTVGVGDHGKSTRALGDALRERGHRTEVKTVIGPAIAELAAVSSTKTACGLLGWSRATLYRDRHGPMHGPKRPRPAPANALDEDETAAILTVLRLAEYCDLAPAQVWARFLDDAIYLCSIATMYRILRSAGEHRERRRQRTHPARKRPERIAYRPNEVWSWDFGWNQCVEANRFPFTKTWRSAPGDISDEEWALISDQFQSWSGGGRIGRPAKHDKRRIVDTVFHVAARAVQTRLLLRRLTTHPA